MGELTHWLSGLHIGSFITANKELLTAIISLLTIWYQGRKITHRQDKLEEKQDVRQKEAAVERRELMRQVETNTVITQAVLESHAAQRGIPVEDLIANTGTRLDELMRRHLDKQQEAQDAEARQEELIGRQQGGARAH